MSLIIVKFGGSSLTTPGGRNQALSIIKKHRRKKRKVLVVVSAMGRQGDPYATDTLLAQLQAINPNCKVVEQDLLLSCGEIISAVFMTERLRRAGMKACSVSGGQAGIITTHSSSPPVITAVHPYRLQEALAQGVIPVVAGFQGVTWTGEVTTLGRGGSDLTAVALGVALKAQQVEIYTDVGGMMTGDPRQIPQAQILDEMSYQEALAMSSQGAQVIHPQAIVLAEKYQLELLIAGTFHGQEGTRIQRESAWRNPVTGLASRRGMVFFQLLAMENGRGYLGIFPLLAAQGISLDCIQLQDQELRFLVAEKRARETTQILDEEGFYCKKRRGLVKISIIGNTVTDSPWVMKELVESLTAEKVDIISCSVSQMWVSILLKEEKEVLALRTLHTALGLDKKGKENLYGFW